jgi:hypothetical protein
MIRAARIAKQLAKQHCYCAAGIAADMMTSTYIPLQENER